MRTAGTVGIEVDVHVVIVGNGVAGIEAALAVRRRERSWRITVVSEESDHFFSRTALMYVLAGQMSYRDIEPLERDAYARLDLARVRARAIGLDAAAHELVLADGSRLRYDRLLIASGSRPRRGPWPGHDLAGVGHLVTMQDLQWLEREIHGRSGVDAPPRPEAHLAGSTPDSPYQPRQAAAALRGSLARRPVVIGGGLIGVECVETMLAAGLAPVFVIREDWFWPVALDARESAWIADAMRQHGVDVRIGEEVRALEGALGAVERVVTDRGTIGADLVVVAIGVAPNTGWIGDAVACDEIGGIFVDDELRTSAPDVWAAGDCASVRWFNGWVRPEQLWYTARDQGRIAGRQLVGDTARDGARYARGTWYNSAKLMDIEYTTVGLVNMQVPGEQIWFHQEKGAVESTTRIVHTGERVIGFNFLGRRWDHSVCIRWIEERRSLGYVLAHLDEARFDTEFVPPLRVPQSALP
jgi:NADPH-dependent 2,4-dienoyl-CoA reductase/sulfur reductase-like enzyme